MTATVLIAIAGGYFSRTSLHERYQASVISVIDGDTIEVSLDGQTRIVRLLGIDTPETHHPDKAVQCFGPEAETYTRALLNRREVFIEYDIEKQDKYSRDLAYVYLSGNRVNDHLVKNGYARILNIEPNNKYAYELMRAEMDAKQNRRGLWSHC